MTYTEKINRAADAVCIAIAEGRCGWVRGLLANMDYADARAVFAEVASRLATLMAWQARG